MGLSCPKIEIMNSRIHILESLKEQSEECTLIIRLNGAQRDKVGELVDFLRRTYDLQFSYIRQHDEVGITFFINQDLPQLENILTNQYPQGEWLHENGCHIFILQ